MVEPESKNRVEQSGFTLLEMLIALALMATISVMALALFQGVLHSSELTKGKSTSLMRLQFAFSVMENDFSQVVPFVSLRGDDGQIAQEGDVHFYRGNWLNPNGLLQRSQTEEVIYRLTNGNLYKISTAFSASNNVPQVVTTLLTNVSDFRVLFYHGGQWQEGSNILNVLPEAVRINIKFSDEVEFSRTMLVAKY